MAGVRMTERRRRMRKWRRDLIMRLSNRIELRSQHSKIRKGKEAEQAQHVIKEANAIDQV